PAPKITPPICPAGNPHLSPPHHLGKGTTAKTPSAHQHPSTRSITKRQPELHRRHSPCRVPCSAPIHTQTCEDASSTQDRTAPSAGKTKRNEQNNKRSARSQTNPHRSLKARTALAQATIRRQASPHSQR